jgi:hypothetical protein
MIDPRSWESSEAWRTVLDDPIGRGLCRSDLPDR